MSTAVVIPMHKVEAGAYDLIARTTQSCECQVFVVNDGYHGSLEHGDALSGLALRGGARFIEVPFDRIGLAAVYRFGIQHVINHWPDYFNFIIEMDSGGSHNPVDIPAFINALAAADVVTGCRFGNGQHHAAWQRRLLSYAGTVTTNLRYGTRFTDATSGFIGYRREAAEVLHAEPWRSTGHYYQTELRLRALALGLRLAELPIVYEGGTGSSLNFAAIREAIKLTIRH